jgi:type IV fimbrial biogenesis protein FimT
MLEIVARQGGLTLVELMVTLAVSILLLAIGIPLFQGITASSRSSTQANALVEAFTLARNEAVKRGSTVSVCARATNTDTPALMACGIATQWGGNGWFVFTDAEGTTPGVYEPASETVLRIWGPAATVINTAATSIGYRSSGELLNTAAVTFDVYKSGCTGDNLRQVAVSLVGRLSTTVGTCP